MPAGAPAAGAPGDDPFRTADLRAAVLTTWSAAPARFREDANAEELLSIGYRGRVIAELAANGADAARAAGVPGEIAISMVGRELRVANNGAPLDAAGVAALASLRASAKRGEASVGHFGVGFTAVRALTDEPMIVSTTGAVRFSVAETHRVVTELDDPRLDEELRQRHGELPALRLPWPVPVAAREGDGGVADTPVGYATEVRLPLRAAIDAAALAGELTRQLAMDLLWALPDLVAVTVPGLRVERAQAGDTGIESITVIPVPDSGLPAAADSADSERTERRNDTSVGAPAAEPATEETAFRVLRRDGAIPAELLVDRPIEERRRTMWRLAWIVPLDARGRPAGMARSLVGAPTPTDEAIAMPARLVITAPVDESRGRIAASPLTDYLITQAAATYVDLVRGAPAGDRIALLPPVAFPLGEFDAALREALTANLERADFLPGASGFAVRPTDAMLVSGVRGAAAACASEALPGLLDWPARAADVERLRQLGVREVPISHLTEALAQLDRPAAFWRTVYDGLTDMPADELADLPVPASGGGTIVGPRGVLLPAVASSGAVSDAASGAASRLDGDAASMPAGSGTDTGVGDAYSGAERTSWPVRAARLVPGLRLAAPGADHPLLRRLGARSADAAAILADPSLAREIRRRFTDLDSGLSEEPDLDDLAAFASLVLDLLREAGSGAAESAVGADLADTLLTDEDGEPWPARNLLLPGAPLASVLASEAEVPTVAPRWVTEYGAELLETLGVRTGFGLLRFTVPPGADVDLPGVDLWWEQAGEALGGADYDTDDGAGSGADGETHTAITDLDLVADLAWPRALELILGRQSTRDALRRTAFGPSYSAWWLARYAVIDGSPLRRWRAPGSTELAGLYDEIPVALAADVCADIGVPRTVVDAAADPGEFLHRWADPARTVPPWRVAGLTAALVGALDRASADELPEYVRALTGAVIAADDAVVLDDPMLAQVLDPAKLVAGGADPRLTGDVLDLPLASEEFRFTVLRELASSRPAGDMARDPGREHTTALEAVPGAARCLDLCGRADLGGREVRLVPDLVVAPADEETRAALPAEFAGGAVDDHGDDHDGGTDFDSGGDSGGDTAGAADGDGVGAVRVSWWIDDEAILLDGAAAGVGRVVAHLAGRWSDRHLFEAAARGLSGDLAEAGLD
ncbi:MAG: hypothetical protein BGO26_09940 [Actinobacteria bacterium 69-20]|nr:hypothetical protein [Actinomycetota bacterium]OJV23227.1 MAG: hypothetical protein BGO26_09940 [Actinobacteria bacterium 69-20]